MAYIREKKHFNRATRKETIAYILVTTCAACLEIITEAEVSKEEAANVGSRVGKLDVCDKCVRVVEKFKAQQSPPVIVAQQNSSILSAAALRSAEERDRALPSNLSLVDMSRERFHLALLSTGSDLLETFLFTRAPSSEDERRRLAMSAVEFINRARSAIDGSPVPPELTPEEKLARERRKPLREAFEKGYKAKPPAPPKYHKLKNNKQN